MKRLCEVSLQNVLYCIGVLAIHLLTAKLLENDIVFALQRVLFLCVFGFVFLSGLKQCYGDKKVGAGVYYLGRLKKIALPYIISATVYFFVFSSERGYELSDYPRLILTGRAEAHFYFVIAILQLYLVTPAIKYLLGRIGAVSVLAFSFAISALTSVFFCGSDYYNIFFTRYLFIYALGCCAGKYYDDFVKFARRFRGAISIAFCIGVTAELISVFLLRNGCITNEISQLVIMLYMPTASVFVFSVCCGLGRVGENRFVKLIDRNSYSIFLWQILVNFLSDSILGFADISNAWLYFALRCVVSLSLFALILAVKEYISMLFKSKKTAG